MINNVMTAPFNGSGKLPSKFQQEILEYIKISVQKTNIVVATPVFRKQFVTKPVIDHFVNLGYRKGTVSSALNILREKGWLTNVAVPGHRWKVWYC